LVSEHILHMDGVSKRFRKGELVGSLGNALPALVAKFMARPRNRAASPREFWALRDVSFSVKRGEALGIIGHNGAGKSTILKLLSHLLKPTKGTIEVNGSLSALIEVGAGFHPDLTGRENIFLNGAIYGLSKREVAKKFDQIVEFSGLAEFLDTPVKRYSTGMYARLGFAVSAHVDSDILIVDEVLSVGDYLFQKKCMARMKEILDRGSAIVFVSHSLDTVAAFCSRAILLDHGEIVAEGEPKDVILNYIQKAQTAPTDGQTKDAFVSRLAIRGENGPQVQFQAGDDVWLDVDVNANRRCDGLSLALYLRNSQNIEVFYTSTLRLGLPSYSLNAGETKRLTIHLKLHLGGGEFHLGATAYHYDGGVTRDESGIAKLWTIHDDRFPIGTLFVNSFTDVGSAANLYPEITMGQSPHLSNLLDCFGDHRRQEEVRSVPRGQPALLIGTHDDTSADGDGLVSKLVSTR
jgi:ABC-type polysaccharide/polyol phosphate transport system ATPase subunit